MKILTILIFLFLLGCGVKGDPQHPATSAEIGRGKPTYKRAVKKLKLQQTTDSSELEIDSDGDENEEAE